MKRKLAGSILALTLVATAETSQAASDSSTTDTATTDTATTDSTATDSTATEGTAVDMGEVTIGALWLDASTFYSAVQVGIEEGAGAVDVRLIGNNSEGDVSVEADQMETLIAGNVDAIIISAVGEASEAQIAAAAEAGIPVICYNTCIENYEEYVYSYVTGSHMQQGGSVGRATGEYIVEQGIEGAKIGVVSCEQFAACQDRVAGFTEELLKLAPDAEIVASEEALEIDASTTAVSDMLTANPDIDIIYGEAGNMVSGAAVAIREADSDVVVFGHDITIDTAALLLDGSTVQYINAIIGEEMGQTTIDLALAAVRGEPSPGPLFNQDPVDFFASDPDAVQAWVDAHPNG